jgi:Zn-finger nucleic acid-binding protein
MSSMRCPRDAAVLASNDERGLRYYSCKTCAGYWVPGFTLQEALARAGATLPALDEQPTTDAVRCPACHKPSRIFRFKDCEIDLCEHCRSVWLDGGELLKLKALFPENAPYVIAEQNRPEPPSPEAAAAKLVMAVAEAVISLVG